MTTALTTIEIPRLPNESARAYAARVEYVTMGPGRSLARLGQSSGRHKTLYEQWSAKYGWVESARRYDEAVAYITVQEAAAAYRRDLEEHRERASKAGKALYGVAVEMLGKLRSAPVEYTPATLATIARALTVALDIEAHALRVADLLPRLDNGEPNQQ